MEDEKILVVINPSDKEVSFKSDLQLGEVIYSYNGEVKSEGGMIVLPAGSVSFTTV